LYYLSIDEERSRADSEMWKRDLFDKMFRFRREHFFCLLNAMDLRDKTLLCCMAAAKVMNSIYLSKSGAPDPHFDNSS